MERIKKELYAFFFTFSFFSRIRTPKFRFDFEEIFPLSLKYIPIFALISGGFLYILLQSIHYLTTDRFMCALIILGVQYFLFNYFHFDGLLDTADGFLGGMKNREDILRIMSDAHRGSFAILIAVIYIATKIYLYFFLIVPKPILIIPTFFIGRISMLLVAFIFPKPAKEVGLGSLFINYARGRFLFFPLLSIFFPLYFFPLETSISILCAFLFSLYSIKVIGGLTGDVLGSICEMTELLFLLSFFFLHH